MSLRRARSVCLRLSLTMVAVLTTASHAAAALVVSDFLTAGDRLLITDTSTGIQWLSPRYTRGVGVNAVLNGYGQLLTTQGFRYADAAAVRAMIAGNFGATPVAFPGSTQGWTAAQSFFSVFGINQSVTCFDNGAPVACPRTQAFAMDGQQLTPLGMIQFGANGWMIDNPSGSLTQFGNVTDAQFGSWLIREAAPPTVTLTVDRQSARAGEPVRLAVTVTSATGGARGSIQFRDVSTTPATDYPLQPLHSDGSASRLVLPLTGGTHSFVARFLSTGSFTTDSTPHDVVVAAVKGRPYLWGWGGYGQIGDGLMGTINPLPVANSLVDAINIVGGETFSLALGSDGTVWSWGNDQGYGSLGQGPGVVFSPVAKRITVDANGNAFTGVVAIAAGRRHALAVKYDGGQYTVWAWGDNNHGQLGDATIQNQNAPVQVKVGGLPLTGVVSVASGDAHSLALTWDGTVWAWGFGANGEIGNGSTSLQNPPSAINSGFEATRIAAGASHSLALDTAGRVLAWGYNAFCQLGTGCGGRSLVPVVAQLIPAPAVAIDAGEYHSVALMPDGTVRTWGYNIYGQTGSGSFAQQVASDIFQLAAGTPVTDVVQVSAFGYSTTVLRNDGTAWTAGYNYEGELGDGSWLQSAPYGKSFAVRVAANVPYSALGDGYLTLSVIAGPNRAPVANPGASQALEATGPSGATFALDGTKSTDPDGDALDYLWIAPTGSVSGSQVNITLPPPGVGARGIPYVVTLVVTDAFGATATANVVQTVVDTTPPIISGLPQPISVSATDAAGAVVTFGPLSANDLVDGIRPVTCDRQSGSVFPVGTTTVTCQTADLHGNSVASSFTVTVLDTTGPSIAISAPRSTLYKQNQVVTTAFTCVDPSGVTACEGVSSTPGSLSVTSGGALDTSTTGQFVFTVTATDAYGNTSTRTVSYEVVKSIELLVTDTANKRVLAFDLGTLALRGKLVPERAGGLTDAGCAIVRDAYLYVCDPAQFAILRYDAQTGAPRPSAGNAGALFATNVAQLGPFAAPTSLSFGADGHLYVATNHGNTVERYDVQTGQPLPAPGQTGATFAQTLSGAGVDGASFGPDGRLYVSHFSPASVWRFDGTTGAFLAEIVPGGPLTGSRNDYLTVGPDGNLYVSGRGDFATASQGFVRRYSLDGAPLPAPGKPGAVVSEVPQIASSSGFGPDGRLYLTTWNYAGQSDLVQIDPESGAVLAHVQLPPGTVPAAVAFTHDAVVSREPTLSVTGGSFVYDGQPHAAACSATGPFGEPLTPVTVLYGGVASAPIPAGSYSVQCRYAGDDLYLSGSATTELTITPAPASITLLNLAHVYDGTPKAPTVMTAPAGLAFSMTIDGATSAPVNAGSYAVVVSLTDPNYTAAVVTGTMAIAKAPSTVTLTAGTFTYDGAPHAATARVSDARGNLLAPPTITYDGGLSAPVNAGTYTVVASFGGDPNHQPASASAQLVIRKAVPRITWARSAVVSVGPMGYPRRSHAAVELNDGRVLIAGSDDFSPTAELFTPATRTFARTGDLTVDRCYGCAAAKLPDGNVLIAGGWSGGPVLDSAEVYNASTGQFALLESRMSSNRLGAGVVVLRDSRLLIVGGHNGFTPWATAEIFDPATMSFSATASMHAARLSPLTLLNDGRALAAGGMSSTGAYLATAEIYDPAAATWSATGSMAIGRHGHSAVTLRDGRVLITGGLEETSRLATAVAEVFDPATGAFTRIRDMVSARVGHSATVLPSGEVLIAGGNDSTGVVLDSTEIFDPITNAFRPGTPLRTARAGFAATVLRDGRVLITGGEGAGGGRLATAELYEEGALAPIVYGTRLGDAQLNATATISGSFAYTPSAGTRLNAGTHTLRVEFTPSDQSNYEPIEATAMLTVLKARPTMQGLDAHATYDGQLHPAPVTVTGVDRENLAPVVVTYNGASTVPVDASNYSVAATFGGDNNYEPISGSGRVVIDKAIPAITWAPSAFVSVGPMAYPRRSQAAVELNDGRVLIAGSADFNPTAELFTPETRAFARTGDLTVGRCYGCAAAKLPDGKVLIAGGWSGGPVLDSAEVYNPATGQFALLESRMSSNRLGASVVVLRDSRLLIVGGHNGFTPWATADIFDPATMSFSATASMHAARLSPLALLNDGRALAAGGMSSSGAYLATAEIYDPATATWSATGSMAIGRHGHSVVTLRDGRVLITGGLEETSRLATGVAEVFDPATGAFTRIRDMLRARVGHSATVLPSGEVLIAGGIDAEDIVLDSTEIFDPVSNAFRPGTPLRTARDSFAATVLRDGRILITGGEGAGGARLATAELYEEGVLAPIVYGTRLGDAQLNATATLSGSFAYTPPAGARLNGGSHTLRVEFTPDDQSNYESVQATAMLTVMKARPTMQGLDAHATYDGQLHPALVTVKGVDGEDLAPVTVTYNGSATVPVNAGSYTVAAMFGGDNNYEPVSGSGGVVIDKATPVIRVDGGVFVKSGTPHPATGSVTGVGGAVIARPTLVYKKLPNGNLLSNPPASAGIYEVTASFSGDANYGPASATATLVINEPPVITGISGPTISVLPGSQATLFVTFSDPETNDAHTCTFAWADGTSTTTTTLPPAGSTCQAAHAYNAQGVYDVVVTVTDDDNLSTQRLFESIAVSARTGTVSGGGSVVSPAGAFVANPALAGTASITLSVRYAKGATVPSGTTTFTYSPARLSFSVSTYQWLVVAGGKAWYRGNGIVTVNGQSSSAEFLVAATDGPDMLRFRIWNQSGVIYDNQPGATQSASATPPMTSGPASLAIR